MFKRIFLLGLAASALGLCARSFFVWSNCGYDCPIFPATFPFRMTATFGGIIGAILSLALVAMALATLLKKGQ